jgi:hypothetical protein
MGSSKSLKLARKSALLQKDVLTELEALMKSIARGEKMIVELKEEMELVGTKHRDRKTTQDDIAYLEDLLRCAKKKLAWENQMASLAKRTPELLAKVSGIMNDPLHPPDEEVRMGIMRALQSIQAAMERLEQAKVQ